MQNCPNCGCSLRKYEPLTFGNVEIDPAGAILFCGREILMPPTQHAITETLIRARGRVFCLGTLANILGGEIDDKSVTQYIQRARASFRQIRPDFDQIETVRGAGYRWKLKASEPVRRPRTSWGMTELRPAA